MLSVVTGRSLREEVRALLPLGVCWQQRQLEDVAHGGRLRHHAFPPRVCTIVAFFFLDKLGDDHIFRDDATALIHHSRIESYVPSATIIAA